MSAPGRVCSCGRLRTPSNHHGKAWLCDHCDTINPDGPCDTRRCPYCTEYAASFARRNAS